MHNLPNNVLAAIYLAVRKDSDSNPSDVSLRDGAITLSREIARRCRKNQSVHEWLTKQGGSK